MKVRSQSNIPAFLQTFFERFAKARSPKPSNLLKDLFRYGIAATIILLALWLRFSLTPLIGNESPFMVLAPAAILAAGLAGLGPGIMALVAALVLGHYFFSTPPGAWGPFGPAEISLLITYGLTNLLAILLLHFLRKSKIKAEELANRSQRRGTELEREMQERKKVTEELKIARDRLDGYANELETQVASRTAAMQESIRSLESILYHVAHDLRAPLRAMQGFASLLIGPHAGQLDEAGKDCAHRISKAAEQMDRLLQDLLEYGRICSVQIVPVKLLLGHVLESVLKKLSGRIHYTNSRVQIEGTFPAVWADSGLLQEVLFNLLSNAFNFVAPPARPEVRVWAELKGGFVRVWIQDNGIGIPPEHHERIFRIFERLHASNTLSGTGIGLASAKKAVERMHGSLGVESNRGTGSRFWLELPISPPLSSPSGW